MTWWEALILGVVQGLTEFLPISSSAHLSIVGQLLGRDDPGSAFTAIVQIGTEAAVILYFAKDIGRIIKRWVLALFGKVPQSDPDVRMGWLVIIGSVPIVVLGLLFQDYIDHALRNLWVTVAMLGGVAVLLFLADRFARHVKPLEKLSWRDGIFYGLAQSLALIPGVSRSGATISAGLAMGYTREAAARYSFLLAIPAVLGSGFYKLTEISADPTPPNWLGIGVATVVSFAVGLGVIHWLLRYVSRNNFTIFVVYRLILAAVVAVLLLTGVLHPLP
ncbi:undecaprenyl-diphosphate phosphatase [Enemella sp. A6]|uniref:undecaprenyl-diphosphate phosphatase n=1 Tax=Enemella sp. A6 TaxID=3440152 RepID=UPI003EBA301B